MPKRLKHHAYGAANTVNSLYCGHPRDRELVSLTARVRHKLQQFISVKHLYSVFAGDLAAVRIIEVSVIARCPQGES